VDAPYSPVAFQRAETEVEDELRDALRRSKRQQQQAATDVVALVDRPEVQGEVVQGVVKALSAASEAPTDPQQFMYQKADEYDRIRSRMPEASDRRTHEMSRIAAEVRAAAQTRQLPTDVVRDLFRSGDGGRVVALTNLGANPDPSLADEVGDGIARSKSGFEQYHALRAAEALAPRLPESARRKLADAIRGDMGEGGFIGQNTDRWPVAERVLALLESPGEPR